MEFNWMNAGGQNDWLTNRISVNGKLSFAFNSEFLNRKLTTKIV